MRINLNQRKYRTVRADELKLSLLLSYFYGTALKILSSKIAILIKLDGIIIFTHNFWYVCILTVIVRIILLMPNITFTL